MKMCTWIPIAVIASLAQQGVAISGFEIATVAALPRNDNSGIIQHTGKAHFEFPSNAPSIAAGRGGSEKVSQQLEITSSFRAGLTDAYRDVGGRATQDAKAEERREAEDLGL